MPESSGILSRIAEAQADTYRPKCTIGKTVESLSKQDQEELQEALYNPEFYGTVIAKVLGVSEYSLRRHRRHLCKCYRDEQ
jgi:hypothetical protein